MLKHKSLMKWKSKQTSILSESSNLSNSSSNSSISYVNSKVQTNCDCVIKVDVHPRHLNRPSTCNNRPSTSIHISHFSQIRNENNIKKTPRKHVNEFNEYNKYRPNTMQIYKRKLSENMAEPHTLKPRMNTPNITNCRGIFRQSIPIDKNYSIAADSRGTKPFTKGSTANKTTHRICQHKCEVVIKHKVNDTNNRTELIGNDDSKKYSMGIPMHTAARAEHRKLKTLQSHIPPEYT